MEKIQLLGAEIETDGTNIKVVNAEPTEKEVKASCSGNACGDIDYQWDDNTRSYHFYNDGGRNVLLKVYMANYFGCSGVSKTRRMRPGEEWDSGFFGICNYQANYR